MFPPKFQYHTTIATAKIVALTVVFQVPATWNNKTEFKKNGL